MLAAWFRSSDAGSSWKPTAARQVDKISQSTLDPKHLFLRGRTGKLHWYPLRLLLLPELLLRVSVNGGATLLRVETEAALHDVSYHPLRPLWTLAFQQDDSCPPKRGFECAGGLVSMCSVE